MNDDYPKAYREGGLRQLMRLTRYRDDYNEFLAVLAQKIVDAALTSPLDDYAALPELPEISNAFEPAGAVPAGHARVTGGVSKACFAFIAAQRHEITQVRQMPTAMGRAMAGIGVLFTPRRRNRLGL